MTIHKPLPLIGILLTLSIILLADDASMRALSEKSMQPTSAIVKLPSPKLDSRTSLEEALLKRRSIRDFQAKPLELAEISQLLWAAQGITDPEGLRTAPSAGALYPLEVYLAAGDLKNLPAGIYLYLPKDHSIRKIVEGDKRKQLASACWGQFEPKEVPALIIISADYSRTAKKYKERATGYVHLEAGHVAQNVYLQAVSLNLGTFVMGAFDDQQVKRVLELPEEQDPLYVMPIGRPKSKK